MWFDLGLTLVVLKVGKPEFIYLHKETLAVCVRNFILDDCSLILAI